MLWLGGGRSPNGAGAGKKFYDLPWIEEHRMSAGRSMECGWRIELLIVFACRTLTMRRCLRRKKNRTLLYFVFFHVPSLKGEHGNGDDVFIETSRWNDRRDYLCVAGYSQAKCDLVRGEEKKPYQRRYDTKRNETKRHSHLSLFIPTIIVFFVPTTSLLKLLLLLPFLRPFFPSHTSKRLGDLFLI